MKLPCGECKGKCCFFVAMTNNEFKKLRKKYGVPKGAKVLEMPGNRPGKSVILKDGQCAYLDDGRCSVYEDRPVVCREYGVNPHLPCMYLEMK